MNSTLKLDMLEFLVLAECAQVEWLPTTLQFINHVDPEIDLEDIDQLFAAARILVDKEILSEEGEIHEDAWNLLATFNRTTIDFDLIYQTGPEEEMRASVCCAGPLAVQLVTDGYSVELTELFPEDAIPELLSLLPEPSPVEIPPDLAIDLEALSGVEETATDIDDFERRLREVTGDNRATEMLSDLFSHKVEGHGQLGVSILDGDDLIRCDQVIKFYDLEVGRVGLWNESGQRRVTPWSRNEFQRAWVGIFEQAQASCKTQGVGTAG